MIKSVNKIILSSALMLCLSIAFLAFDTSGNYQPKQTIIEIMLDSIPPGPISIKQLFAVKQIRVTSAGADGKIIEHKVKSGQLTIWGAVGLGSSTTYIKQIDLTGNRIIFPLSSSFSMAQVGATISLGGLTLEDLGSNYKCLAYPNWGVVAEKDATKK